MGIASFKTEFGEDVPEAELVAKVQELNNDPNVHGACLNLVLGLDLGRYVCTVRIVAHRLEVMLWRVYVYV